jgi:hypothetical protein
MVENTGLIKPFLVQPCFDMSNSDVKSVNKPSRKTLTRCQYLTESSRPENKQIADCCGKPRGIGYVKWSDGRLVCVFCHPELFIEGNIDKPKISDENMRKLADWVKNS